MKKPKSRAPDRKTPATSHTHSDTGAAETSRLQIFLHLSCVLTGEKTLPADLGYAYLERARQHLDSKLEALLDRFSALVEKEGDPNRGVRDEILRNADYGPSARLILLLWYIGGIQNPAGDWEMESADQYYRALVWDAIGAHPPTLSNGYFGHWKYPPER